MALIKKKVTNFNAYLDSNCIKVLSSLVYNGFQLENGARAVDGVGAIVATCLEKALVVPFSDVTSVLQISGLYKSSRHNNICKNDHGNSYVFSIRYNMLYKCNVWQWAFRLGLTFYCKSLICFDKSAGFAKTGLYVYRKSHAMHEYAWKYKNALFYVKSWKIDMILDKNSEVFRLFKKCVFVPKINNNHDHLYFIKTLGWTSAITLIIIMTVSIENTA